MPPVKKPTSATPAAPATAKKSAAAPAPVPATPVKKAAVAEAAPPAKSVADAPASDAPIESPVDVMAGKIAAVVAAIKDAQAALKVLTKSYESLSKAAAKAAKKKESARANPSGFSKPTKISEELCSFLGLAPNTEISRTQTTRLLTAYIRSKDLANPENRRFILPDEPLRKLLRVPAAEKLSYFNLQKYLRPHYVKAV